MRKQLIEHAARELASQVRAVEDSIEAALGELAELQAQMVRARSITGAGFINSHAPFEQLAAATTGIVAARGSIANCHAALVETRKTIPGLRTLAIGDNECPPAQGSANLRIVA